MEHILKNRYENKQPSSLMKLIKCIAPFKKRIIFALIFGAIGAILRLGAPLAIQQISQQIVQFSQTKTPIDFHIVYTWGIIAFAFFFGGFIFDYAQICNW